MQSTTLKGNIFFEKQVDLNANNALISYVPKKISYLNN